MNEMTQAFVEAFRHLRDTGELNDVLVAAIREASKPQQHKCPECGGDLLLKEDPNYGNKFYACSNYPSCDVTCVANSDLSLKGTPANKETRTHRKSAYNALASLWEHRIMSKDEVFRWLSETTDKKLSDMDISECQAVVRRVEEKRRYGIPRSIVPTTDDIPF